jgi:glutamate synthase (NADPH/NADH) large chain
VLGLIKLHYRNTSSQIAKKVLDNWDTAQQQFVKVMPTDYKRVLAERAAHDEEQEATLHGVMADG